MPWDINLRMFLCFVWDTVHNAAGERGLRGGVGSGVDAVGITGEHGAARVGVVVGLNG